MGRTLHVDPSDAVPIWKQIEDGARRLVASGAWKPGAPVPSVREMSRDLRINPATVAKAYQKLTDAGVLAVRRGEGTFVAETPPTFARTERRRILHDGAARYAAVAVTLGATRDEAVDEVEHAWTRIEPGPASRGDR